MKTPPPAALLLAALLVLSQCKTKDPAPEDQLPPATQTGANTFGCLVNGQVWTPKGNSGRSNYTVDYDPTYGFGILNISAYRYNSNDNNSRQDIILFSDSLLTTGIYSLTIPNRQEALFYGSAGQCEFHQNENHYRRGKLTITRLDPQAGIVSGTFAFTLYKAGCDSVRVTQGRFDKRL